MPLALSVLVAALCLGAARPRLAALPVPLAPVPLARPSLTERHGDIAGVIGRGRCRCAARCATAGPGPTWSLPGWSRPVRRVGCRRGVISRTCLPCGHRGRRRWTRSHLAVPGESAWDDRVGLREIRRDGAVAPLNGALPRSHGASINEDAKGDGDALTGPRHGRDRGGAAAGARCQRDARPARPVGAITRAAGPRRDHGLAGRRPGRRAGARGRRTRRARRTQHASVSRSASATLHPASVGHRLEPGRRTDRWEPLTTPPRSLRTRHGAVVSPRKTPAASCRLTSGLPPAAGAGRDLPQLLDAVALTNYIGW